MTNLKTHVEICGLAKEVKANQRWANEYIKDRDEALAKLNSLLITSGGRALSLEEVLKTLDNE